MFCRVILVKSNDRTKLPNGQVPIFTWVEWCNGVNFLAEGKNTHCLGRIRTCYISDRSSTSKLLGHRAYNVNFIFSVRLRIRVRLRAMVWVKCHYMIKLWHCRVVARPVVWFGTLLIKIECVPHSFWLKIKQISLKFIP